VTTSWTKMNGRVNRSGIWRSAHSNSGLPRRHLPYCTLFPRQHVFPYRLYECLQRFVYALQMPLELSTKDLVYVYHVKNAGCYPITVHPFIHHERRPQFMTSLALISKQLERWKGEGPHGRTSSVVSNDIRGRSTISMFSSSLLSSRPSII